MKKTLHLLLIFILAYFIVLQNVDARAAKASKNAKGKRSGKRKKKPFPTENNIIMMNDRNFEKVINTYQNVFVYFYVPFCSHEGQLTSTFQKTYNKYYKRKSAIKFGKINAYINKQYSEQFGLRGFPTIILFQGSIDKQIRYESEVALYDFRSFIDIHVFNRIRSFTTYEQYYKNKLGFEIAFMGNKLEFPQIYKYFVERSKISTLFRFIYLPQTKSFYYGLANEFQGNETEAFIPYPPDEPFSEKRYLNYSYCELSEPGDEKEVYDDDLDEREYFMEQYREYAKFERARRQEVTFREHQNMSCGHFCEGIIQDYSVWEDHFEMGNKNDNMKMECKEYKQNYSNNEDSQWRTRRKTYGEDLAKRKLKREFAPYIYQYQLRFQFHKSYVLLMKRHDNFTAPIELVDDDVQKFKEDFERLYQNYSTFTQPLRKWNQKIKNYMIESERKAIVLFTRFKIKNEK